MNLRYLRFVQILQTIGEVSGQEAKQHLQTQAHLGFQITKALGMKLKRFDKYLELLGLGKEKAKLKKLDAKSSKQLAAEAIAKAEAIRKRDKEQTT